MSKLEDGFEDLKQDISHNLVDHETLEIGETDDCIIVDSNSGSTDFPEVKNSDNNRLKGDVASREANAVSVVEEEKNTSSSTNNTQCPASGPRKWTFKTIKNG